jgi:hypothetical protein
VVGNWIGTIGLGPETCEVVEPVVVVLVDDDFVVMLVLPLPVIATLFELELVLGVVFVEPAALLPDADSRCRINEGLLEGAVDCVREPVLPNRDRPTINRPSSPSLNASRRDNLISSPPVFGMVLLPSGQCKHKRYAISHKPILGGISLVYQQVFR